MKLMGGAEVLTGTAPKATEPVDKVPVEAVDVPLRVTVCVWPGTAKLLSVKVSVAVRLPTAVGVKVIVAEQLPNIGSCVGLNGQLLVRWKSPGFAPPRATLLMVSGPFPRFERDTVAGPLVVPNGWLPKITGAPEMLTSGPVPLPDSPTVWVLPLTAPLLSVNWRVAVRWPSADGAKVTLTEQLVLTARGVAGEIGQLMFWNEKSLWLIPVRPMLVMVSGAVPSFKR